MIATINGIQLAYSDVSDAPDPRLTLLLVHGFMLNRSMWEPQLAALRHRARIITPDLRGFGASEAGPSGPLTMQQHADDLAVLPEYLEVPGPVVYCGLSMGGYVGFQFWRRHRARIAGLVLADTRATPDTPEQRDVRLSTAARADELADPAPVIDSLAPRMFAPARGPADAVICQVLAMMTSTSFRTAADGQRGLAQRPDSVALLPEIDVPTLIIVGEHDRVTPPAESDLMAERLPRAALVTVPGAGHMSNLEAPEVFNPALLAYLDSLRP
jgi:3-oxoadipate enol-lactonase